LKGKIARTVATKTALSIRVDALGEVLDGSLGLEYRAKVEARLMQLEGRAGVVVNAAAVGAKPVMKKVEILASSSFNPSSDLMLQDGGVKRKADDDEEVDEAAAKKAKKDKKKAKKAAEEEVVEEEVEVKAKKAKKQKKDKKLASDE
jgi:nucleolar protein 58